MTIELCNILNVNVGASRICKQNITLYLQDILQNTTWMNFAQLDKKVHFKCKDHNTTHPLSFIILLTRLFRDIDLVCTQFLILLARILKTKTPTS